jgi:hypothetical protein
MEFVIMARTIAKPAEEIDSASNFATIEASKLDYSTN